MDFSHLMRTIEDLEQENREQRGGPSCFPRSYSPMEQMIMNMKGQKWQSWFDQEIPRLGNVTPREASETVQGREKLEKLFADFEESSRFTEPALNLNVPAPWARWKLGMGPGNAEEFAEEEAIFNSPAQEGTTKRKPKHEEKLRKRQDAVFVPRRCELKGCDKVGESVQKCSACALVFYCSKEHQAQDWPRHKPDCKHLRGSGLLRKYFLTVDELEKYPLGCFPIRDPPSGAKLSCFICGAGGSEVKLGRTDCCNLPVCDNEEEYQMFSYSRDFCKRSHSRYTSCGFHHNNRHAGDWRECTKCDDELPQDTSGVRSWYSTNGFNVTPALERCLTQGSYLTKPCSGCKGRIMPGHDGEIFAYGKTYCARCK